MGHRALVALDGSDHSWKALDHAVEQLEIESVTVIHVIDRADRALFVDTLGGFSDPKAFDRAENAAEDVCAEARRRIEDAGLDPETGFDCAVETGRPARTIVEYAEEHDVDYVVMGSRGLTGVKRVLLGSVAETVVRRSPVPVMVIR